MFSSNVMKESFNELLLSYIDLRPLPFRNEADNALPGPPALVLHCGKSPKIFAVLLRLLGHSIIHSDGKLCSYLLLFLFPNHSDLY